MVESERKLIVKSSKLKVVISVLIVLFSISKLKVEGERKLMVKSSKLKVVISVLSMLISLK